MKRIPPTPPHGNLWCVECQGGTPVRIDGYCDICYHKGVLTRLQEVIAEEGDEPVVEQTIETKDEVVTTQHYDIKPVGKRNGGVLAEEEPITPEGTYDTIKMSPLTEEDIAESHSLKAKKLDIKPVKKKRGRPRKNKVLG